MKLLRYILPGLALLSTLLPAQTSLTLKEIFQEGTYVEKEIANFCFHPDGRHFVQLVGRQVQLFDMGNGQLKEVLFAAPEGTRLNDFLLSPDGKQLLLQTNAESLYRYSQQADYLIYHLATQQLTPLLGQGKQRYATFSPDGQKVAFVYQNDLYYRDLQKNILVQVTQDGQPNRIINGAADWVYEEEFDLTRAYAWAPNGRYLVFLRFDETNVPSFTMEKYLGETYPQYVTWKYPKVGQTVAAVTAHLYDLEEGQTYPINLPETDDPYLPRVGWTPDGQAYLFRMNRHQSRLEIWLAEAATGNAQLLLTERDAAYVNLQDNLTFLPKNKGFLWTSERDGWNHIYHYDRNGRLVEQLTQGDWAVDKIVGYDARSELIYYQSAERTPLERHIYTIQLNGKNKQQITTESGWHEAVFSPDFQNFLHTYSNINRPPTFAIYNNKGNLRYWLEENRALEILMRVNKTQPVNFWDFQNVNGDRLNGWMIQPPDFSKDKKHPVLMYVYGGPGSQRVANRWNAMRDYWWFQLLARNGYIVACVDNRGTGGRGAQFQKQTYLKLGQYETEDQIEAARYLAGQSYVDAQRIGIYGKSYGGYMATLCLLKGGDVFAAGIALAPVTDWKWYDCVYTERYMRTAEENAQGYKLGASVNYADQLVDPLLLVHGLGDDNVHFQHTAELAGKLVAANKPFDTQFYPNINHSLRGGNTAIHLYTKMTDFLDLNLRQTNQPSATDVPHYQPARINPSTGRYDLMIRRKKIPEDKKIKGN